MRTIGLGLLALLSLSSLALSSMPAAADIEVPPTATVPYGDLDLTTEAGAARLRRRIDRTVISISGGDQPAPGSLIPRADLQDARVRGRAKADALISAARGGCDRRP